MPNKSPVAANKPLLIALFAWIALGLTAAPAHAKTGFHLEKDDQGMIRPFKAIAAPLAEFVAEYAKLMHATIATDSGWGTGSNGSVTLFIRHPIKPEALTEIFHRVVADNGYAAVDAPAGNGWILVRSRDARDLALPVYKTDALPDTNRLVTAYRDLKYADSEEVARTMRSFMPANSRIIPTTRSQVMITDTADNIRKLEGVIGRMDTPEGANARGIPHSYSSQGQPRVCGEHRIEKLVVENLEIQEGEERPTGRTNLATSEATPPDESQPERDPAFRERRSTPMRKSKFGKQIVAALLLLSSSSVHAATGDATIRLRSGSMALNDFLAMISDQIGMQIDASGLDGTNKITLPEAGPLSLERAKSLALTSLYLEGYTWIYMPSLDVYRVLKLRDARDQAIPFITNDSELPDSDLLVTYLKPLKQVPAEMVARTLRSFMPAASRIIPIEFNHSVLVSDSAHNISKLRELIDQLDTPQNAQQGKEWLAERTKKAAEPCPEDSGFGGSARQPLVQIALFSLIALVIGFILRGYVIRRIEGGL